MYYKKYVKSDELVKALKSQGIAFRQINKGIDLFYESKNKRITYNGFVEKSVMKKSF